MVEMVKVNVIHEGYCDIVNGLIDVDSGLITIDFVNPEDDLTEAAWTDNYYINSNNDYVMEV